MLQYIHIVKCQLLSQHLKHDKLLQWLLIIKKKRVDWDSTHVINTVLPHQLWPLRKMFLRCVWALYTKEYQDNLLWNTYILLREHRPTGYRDILIRKTHSTGWDREREMELKRGTHQGPKQLAPSAVLSSAC